MRRDEAPILHEVSVTIREVAAKAGVSTATVSHVLNGTQRTRPRTKERVLAAVQELGYSQNQAARNLAQGKSNLLGLLISDIRNPFFPEVTAAFQDQALAHGMDVLVLNTNYDVQRMLMSVKRLIGLRVPGIAVLTSQIDPSIIDLLKDRSIPAVYLDLGRVDEHISNIVLGYEDGIAEAIEHLAGLGHQRIGYIGGTPHLKSSIRRTSAFRDNVIRLGLPPDYMIDGDFTVEGGYFACSKLLSRSSPTAIIAANDQMAIGVLHRASDGGLCVPEDLSVVGFDDILFSQYTQPALTTVALPRAEIGRVAFEALWSMMSKPQQGGCELQLGARLTIRQSTVRPPESTKKIAAESRSNSTVARRLD
jgi:DNA-binding LacI/PurR family transcriptional regulator